ncbi:glycosyltransferase [Azospirillum tabaci]|uniref:glycosyltransferase n=1 Tax=Azospirillum tabaci TaxID=2752310 RepID=UPI001660529E|nr:glycosyltransferase [Azospirillum tabaci]
MKLLQINTFYDEYLRTFYRAQPWLRAAAPEKQRNALLADGFSAAHILAPWLGRHGYEADLLIANAWQEQARWAIDRALTPPFSRQDLIALTARRIEDARPDVLYIVDPIMFDSRFLRALSWKPRLVVGWRAAPIPTDADFSEYDVMLSSDDGFARQALEHGAHTTERFRPGFPSWIAEAVAEEPKAWDVVFAGQVSPDHRTRLRRLTSVGKLPLRWSREVGVRYRLLCGAPDDLPAAVHMHDGGPVWGVAMHRFLRSGRIVFNVHIDSAEQAGQNMRMVETVGTGSFLLTEDGPGVRALFEPGREIEVFRDGYELHDKIRHYLDHPEDREAIARAGQRRCLVEHSMERRAEEFDAMLRRALARAANGARTWGGSGSDHTASGLGALAAGRPMAAFGHLCRAAAHSTDLALRGALAAAAAGLGDLDGAEAELRRLAGERPGDPAVADALARIAATRCMAPISVAPHPAGSMTDLLVVTGVNPGEGGAGAALAGIVAAAQYGGRRVSWLKPGPVSDDSDLDAALLSGVPVLLFHPQLIGFARTLSVIERSARPPLLYLLDSSFFCVRSYNHRTGETGACTACLGGATEWAEANGCLPFPVSNPDAVAWIDRLRPLVRAGRVRLLAQNARQAALARSQFGEAVPIPVIGMWTEELGRLLAPASPGPPPAPDDAHTVVFHGTDHPAKGARWSVEVARHAPRLRFLFPFGVPLACDPPGNAVFQPARWDNGLADAVARSAMTLVPSLWSAPIEAALVKSLACAPAVAVCGNPTAFSDELPGDLVLRLPPDPGAAAVLLEEKVLNGWRPADTTRADWLMRFRRDNAGMANAVFDAGAQATAVMPACRLPFLHGR